MLPGRWQVTAARAAGTVHARRGEACADSFRTLEREDCLVLAVADGAGSARHGGAGSAAASQAAVRLAGARLAGGGLRADAAPPAAIRDVLEGTLQLLVRAAERASRIIAGADPEPETSDPLLAEATALVVQGVADVAEPGPAPLELADLHTTLLLAAATRDALAVGNIGDGWIVARVAGGQIRAVAPPAAGEHANETFFLDSPGALEEAVFEVVDAGTVDALALMSDGSSRFAIDLASGMPSRTLFEKLFAFAADSSLSRAERDRELTAFLASERICRSTEDDKTLVLAVRVPAPAGK